MQRTTHLTVIPMRLLAARGAPDAEGIHKAVMACFDGADLGADPNAVRAGGNILWRNDGFHILIRSTIAPTRLPDGAQTTTRTDEATSGDLVRFTVVVDAIARTSARADDGTRRMSERWIDEHELPAWLTARLTGLTDIAVTDANPTLTHRKGAPTRHIRVSGTARVADERDLGELIVRGVGRSKAFGCGLLTVKVLGA